MHHLLESVPAPRNISTIHVTSSKRVLVASSKLLHRTTSRAGKPKKRAARSACFGSARLFRPIHVTGSRLFTDESCLPIPLITRGSATDCGADGIKLHPFAGSLWRWKAPGTNQGRACEGNVRASWRLGAGGREARGHTGRGGEIRRGNKNCHPPFYYSIASSFQQNGPLRVQVRLPA